MTAAPMPATATAPAVDGWFETDPEPALIGSRCVGSGTYFFPPAEVSRAPGHAGGPTERVRLANRGTLWSYTSAGYQPPEPYREPPGGFEPFAIAAVQLDEEGLVVLGQVPADVSTDALKVGMEMELVVDTLFVDDDGIRQTVWKWRPAGGPSQEARI
ncbi:MAG: OB-fold domain-containing protein [Microthrixaceae bacterium]